MHTDLQKEKDRLRKHLAATYAAHDLSAYTAAFLDTIVYHPQFEDSSTILLYKPDGNTEVPFADELMALAPEKEYYFPNISGDVMHFYHVNSVHELATGTFGLLEPPQTNREWKNSDEETLAIVPARAVTRTGLRLGRGAGFYDTFLAQYVTSAHFTTMAVVPEFAVLDDIPVEPHDVTINVIATAHLT